MKKVKLDVIKPWITKKISDLLGFEDEVLIGFIFGLLEQEHFPDPKLLQVNITAFLSTDASEFCLELWKLLISAQNSPNGIAPEIVAQKKAEILHRQLDKSIKTEVNEKLTKTRFDQKPINESVSQLPSSFLQNSANTTQRSSYSSTVVTRSDQTTSSHANLKTEESVGTHSTLKSTLVDNHNTMLTRHSNTENSRKQHSTNSPEDENRRASERRSHEHRSHNRHHHHHHHHHHHREDRYRRDHDHYRSYRRHLSSSPSDRDQRSSASDSEKNEAVHRKRKRSHQHQTYRPRDDKDSECNASRSDLNPENPIGTTSSLPMKEEKASTQGSYSRESPHAKEHTSNMTQQPLSTEIALEKELREKALASLKRISP